MADTTAATRSDPFGFDPAHVVEMRVEMASEREEIPADWPCQIVRRAAGHLRAHVVAIRADIAQNPYWNGDPSDDEAWRSGIDNAAGGVAGTFAALWAPGFADLIAESWNHQADDMGDHLGHFHAFGPPGGWVIEDERESVHWDWTATVRAALAYLREDAPAVTL
jgi:hypothetical protein